MTTPNRLAIKLKPAGERSVKQGHPWVFSDSIDKQNKKGEAGDLVVLFDQRKNQVFAFGLYDPYSPIRIKIIQLGNSLNLTPLFFQNKFHQAFKIRQVLLSSDTNAYRLIFGENDDMPGLIVDIYNEVGVVKVYSAIWLPYLEWIFSSLVEIIQPKALLIRWSRNLQNLELPYLEGGIVYGELKNSQVQFKEYGVLFETDVIQGHKTGFFLDHRENRHKIGKSARDKTVLDVFSYAGGFSVHALTGGAKEVTSLDISKQAMELARHNASLNPHSGTHLTIAGEAFEELKKLVQAKKQYDIVIIDPPSFAKSKKEQNLAQKKYAELAELGAALTRKGGLLLLASCSSRITKTNFLEIHKRCFQQLKIRYKLIEITEHALDHPIGFKEGAYLKSAYYRMG